MGVKPIATNLFLEYLAYLGLVCVRNKGTSHYIYDYPDDCGREKLRRPVVVRINEKEIPLMHIHTNLQNLGKSKSDFELWLRERTKGKKKSKATEQIDDWEDSISK